MLLYITAQIKFSLKPIIKLEIQCKFIYLRGIKSIRIAKLCALSHGTQTKFGTRTRQIAKPAAVMLANGSTININIHHCFVYI